MKYRVLASVAAAAAIAFAQPVTYLAQEAGKAAEILGLTRKAIGDKKLDALKTFSVEAAVQRNVGTMQINSDVEIFLEMPDKYARVENANGGGGMMIGGGGTTGFNGDRPLQRAGGGGMPGGAMVIRMGGPGGPPAGEKPTPEQLEQMNKSILRSSKTEASRLMLGWFAMAHPSAQADYSYAGEAESPDGKAYVVDVKNADGFAARLFIDEQSRLPLMLTYKAAQPRMISQTMSAPPAAASHAAPAAGASREDLEKQVQEMQRQAPVMADYTLFFDDWRDADGVKFPFKMRRATGGNTTEEWTISKIKVNPKIDPKKFAVDSGS
jgi:hypothetical protein